MKSGYKMNMSSLLLLMIVFISCNEARNIKDNRKNKNENYKETKDTPIYTLKVSVANPYEILVNDMPFDKSLDKGSTTFERPINDLILQSGLQKIRVTLIPDSGKTSVDKSGLDYFDVKIYKYADFSSVGSGGEEIGSIDMSNMSESPLVVLDTILDMNVPYQIDGWSASVDLSAENQPALTKEVLQTYESLRRLLDLGDSANFLQRNSIRDAEIDEAFYHDAELKNEDLEFMQDRIRKSERNMAPINDFKLRFYGDGKIVSLEKRDGKSVLYADDGNQLYYYKILLHRPKEGGSLEIIR